MRLAVYALKPEVRSLEQAWGGSPPPRYRKLPTRGRHGFPFSAWIKDTPGDVPSWASFLAGAVDLPVNLRSRSVSLVIFVRVAGRIFAATFGHAWASLPGSLIEPDFGLRVALNSVNPKRVRGLEARELSARGLARYVAAGVDLGVPSFDVDLYQEMLAKLEGVPRDAEVGSRISGGMSATVVKDLRFEDLGRHCRRLLDVAAKKTFEKSFPMVRDVRPEGDPQTLDRLEAQLIEAMQKGDISSFGASWPDIESYDRIAQYRVCVGRRVGDMRSALDASLLLGDARALSSAPEHFAQARVEAYDGSGDFVRQMPLKACLTTEISEGSDVHALCLSRWYSVSGDYVSRVNDQLRAIKALPEDGLLPRIRNGGGEEEGDYNTRAAEETGLALLDKDNFAVPGESSIEVCDLYAEDGSFIHVKRHSRSATLSHLFAQASVSARLFHLYADYRETFSRKLPARWRAKARRSPPDPSAHKVVIAIATGGPLDLPGGLPFFSKVNLLHHARAIEAMGYPVRLLHVPPE